MNLIQRIDALLPQTQCGKCGHPGCKPYAEGIASGDPINRCPPGGSETVAAIARLLQVPVIDLDAQRGTAPAQVAFIREAECIGCTKCIQACPVDAIIGAAKLMHTVIIDECTGCDLCVAPCPVDCIDMLPLSSTKTVPVVGGLASTESQLNARAARRNHARHRYESRNARLRREEALRETERQARSQRGAAMSDGAGPALPDAAGAQPTVSPDAILKQARVAVAMSRAQLHKSLKAFGHPPIAEQAARLVELQRELDRAEQGLLALQLTPAAPSPAQAPVRDDGALKRAKIQVAMRRAALAKAQTDGTSTEQRLLLKADVDAAEYALRQLDPASAGKTA